MSNNIFLNQDPLLYGSSQQNPVPIPDFNSIPLRSQYYEPYRNDSQLSKDWLGELNGALKELDSVAAGRLSENDEFTSLNATLQSIIQEELLNIIRMKMNSSSIVVDNVKKQLNIIKNVTNEVKNSEKESIQEMNDYLKNYSHLTFDEYRKLKNNNDAKKVKKQ